MASPPSEDWRPHLGRKVTLRYKLHDSDDPFSEAIGVIAAVSGDDDDEQAISILTRSGETKVIPTADILASKLFPV